MIKKNLRKKHLDQHYRPFFAKHKLNHHALYAAILSAIFAFPTCTAATGNDFIVYTGSVGVVDPNAINRSLDADVLVSGASTLNIIGRTVTSVTLGPDSSMENIFNTYAIRDFKDHSLSIDSDSNVVIQGGTALAVELKYVNERGEEISHIVPAKGIYGLSVGSGRIVNEGKLTVKTGYCDYTNGIENLATAGKRASITNKGTLNFLGGSSSETNSESGLNGAYALNNLAYGNGAYGELNNTGLILIKGGDSQFRYGIQTLAFNETEDEGADAAEALLDNAGHIEIKGGSSLNSVGVFAFSSGEHAKATITNKSGGEMLVSGGSGIDQAEASEKGAYGIFAFALNGAQTIYNLQENSSASIRGGDQNILTE